MISLPAEPQGKPKSTGVGSLSLSPEGLLDPGVEPGFPALQEDFYQLSYLGFLCHLTGKESACNAQRVE